MHAESSSPRDGQPAHAPFTGLEGRAAGETQSRPGLAGNPRRDLASDTERIALLSAQPYFAALEPGDLAFLAARMIERNHAPGEIVFLEGDPCMGLYIVQTGQVRIYKLSKEGREQILHYTQAGQSFAEVAVFDGGPNPANVVAMSDVRLLVVPRDTIHDLLLARPQMALSIIHNLSGRLRHMVSLVADLSLHTVTYRLAKLLVSAAAGELASHSMTQQEMAAQLGTVREMVARSLKNLEKLGLLQVEHGRITILDRAGLEDML